MIDAPIFSSESIKRSEIIGTCLDKCVNATPPPGTIPSSKAANVAFFASSALNFLSSSSASVEAPT